MSKTPFPLAPYSDVVIVRPVKAPSESASGILLPGQAKDTTEMGDVLAIGPDVTLVRVRDRVVYSGFPLPYKTQDGEDLLLLREEDCLATVTP